MSVVTTYFAKPVDWIRGAVFKDKDGERKIGISFRNTAEKGVYISKIRGQFKKYTDLVPGLRVLKVNGHDVETAENAMSIINDAAKGSLLVIIAEGFCHHVTKRRFGSPSMQIKEMSIKKGSTAPGNGKVIQVSKCEQNGIFAGVPVGNILISLNGKPVNSLSATKIRMKMAKQITLISVRPDRFGVEKEHSIQPLQQEQSYENIVLVENKVRVMVNTGNCVDELPIGDTTPNDLIDESARTSNKPESLEEFDNQGMNLSDVLKDLRAQEECLLNQKNRGQIVDEVKHDLISETEASGVSFLEESVSTGYSGFSAYTDYSDFKQEEKTILETIARGVSFFGFLSEKFLSEEKSSRGGHKVYSA